MTVFSVSNGWKGRIPSVVAQENGMQYLDATSSIEKERSAVCDVWYAGSFDSSACELRDSLLLHVFFL